MKHVYIDQNKSFGSTVFDKIKQCPFLDMVNHYSSVPLGYNHPVFRSKEFLDEVIQVAGIKTSNGLYQTDQYLSFFDLFSTNVVPNAFKKIHFACTGSLAVEAAIKTALVHFDKVKKSESQQGDILVLQNNFHGLNGFGNHLSNELNNEDQRFLSNIQYANWIKHCEYAEIIAEMFDNPNVAGVLIEPIQCTYGDIYTDERYLVVIAEECRKHGIPLIFDEIQTGFGATGKWWYHEWLSVQPDMVIFGKKAQVSGIMVKEKYAGIFEEYNKLSVTFDGDLIDMIRCKYIIQEIVKSNQTEQPIFDNIRNQCIRILAQLDQLAPLIQNARGFGGIIAFDLKSTVLRDQFYNLLYDNKLLSNPTAEKTIRLRPALNFTDQECDIACSILKKTAESFTEYNAK